MSELASEPTIAAPFPVRQRRTLIGTPVLRRPRAVHELMVGPVSELASEPTSAAPFPVRQRRTLIGTPVLRRPRAVHELMVGQ